MKAALVLPRSRRGAERVAVNHELAPLGEFISEYVSDVSTTGAFVRSHTPLRPGTQVDLRFSIIDDDFETVEATGTVVRMVLPGTSAAPSGMGVVFRELSPHSARVVERVLSRRAPI